MPPAGSPLPPRRAKQKKEWCARGRGTVCVKIEENTEKPRLKRKNTKYGEGSVKNGHGMLGGGSLQEVTTGAGGSVAREASSSLSGKIETQVGLGSLKTHTGQTGRARGPRTRPSCKICICAKVFARLVRARTKKEGRGVGVIGLLVPDCV